LISVQKGRPVAEGTLFSIRITCPNPFGSPKQVNRILPFAEAA
jgi:hypothetical protein